MFTLPKLPYPYSSLEPYIDEETMRIHHDKHHAAYVDNLNKVLAGNEKLLGMPIEELLGDLNQVPQEIRVKVKNNGGGHFNHSLFWQIMGLGKGSEPTGELRNAINSAFGNFLNFREKFSQVALNHFGSGWAWLVKDKGRLNIIDTANQDTPIIDDKIPLLALDVWEHAYYLKYQNRRIEYIQAWWNVVNWADIERRFNKSM